LGGRLKKGLQPRSDVDVVITLDDETQGFDLLVGANNNDSEELTGRKMDALREFASELEVIAKKYHIFMRGPDGEPIDKLDLHGWGRSEKHARTQWSEESRSSSNKRLAVLVYKS
jgi:hypothetical protein